MVKAIIFSLKSGSMMEPNTTSIPNPKKVVVAAATKAAMNASPNVNAPSTALRSMAHAMNMPATTSTN